jgi:hypothetical protein
MQLLKCYKNLICLSMHIRNSVIRGRAPNTTLSRNRLHNFPLCIFASYTQFLNIQPMRSTSRPASSRASLFYGQNSRIFTAFILYIFRPPIIPHPGKISDNVSGSVKDVKR